MPKPTLDDAINIGDPLLSDNFELIFAELPSDVDSSATEVFRVQCKTATKPGITIEEVLVEVFGHTVRHAGKSTVTGSMAVEFVENSEMATYTPLKQWCTFCRDHSTQLGNFKEDYAKNGTFRIFKQDGSIAKEFTIVNCWPKTVPDMSFDGSSSQAIPVPVEFAFDDVRDA
ncbi:hypothetical protein BN7874_215 [Phage NCTB]|jgi:hypothetical protein|nr:hypothetical protein BN7874_215 [Phage NCTB]